MANKDIRLLSGRLKTRSVYNLDSDRTRFLSLDNAEANLGTPPVDYNILASRDAPNGGERQWLRSTGEGLSIGQDANGPTLKVNEQSLPIALTGLQRSGFFDSVTVPNNGFATLAEVLDDIDSALAEINSTATAGLNVFVDSNFNGNGTSATPLSLDSNLKINNIVQASSIVADSIGNSLTILRGDGSNITNFPTNVNAVDSIARNALSGGVGITYDASNGTIAIDSNDANVVLQALEIDQNLTVHGNLNVEGTQTIINTANLSIDDGLIQIAVGNETSDLIDVGFVAHYYNGTDSVHTGLFRDANDPNKSYVLFQSLVDNQFDTTNPPTTVNTSGPGFDYAPLKVSTIDAYKGDFDSAVINSGNLVVSQGNISVSLGDINIPNGKLTADSLDVNIFTLDSGSIEKLRLGTLDSAIAINADSGTITRISFDSIDSDTKSMLQGELVPKDAEGNIDSDQLPDLFLRNDGNDSTTGSITADGGFIGNLDADSADITTLTGDSATFNKFTGRLIGLADSALKAAQLTTARTFQVSGDVTTTAPVPTFDGTANVNMAVSLNAGVVDHTELATDAVRETKIQDGAVTASKIAAGAVDSDIRALVTKAYLDSANIDADTLDSLNSSQFLRSDSNDIVTSDHITWVNGSKARFGGSGDFQIYHDGSNSFISDVGTGDLYITTNGQEVLIKDSENGKLSAEFIPDSAVDLYYNGNLKFETTNTGARVTGIIEADSGTLNGNRIITTADFGDGGGINADELDGLNSTQFLRSDQDDSMAGTLYINDSLSANNITRRNSPVVAGTYGSQIAIPIIKVDASGFLDSVGTVAVDGVDSIQFNDTTGVLTVFTGSGTSLTDSITLDPFTTADLTEDSTALYYTDARATSAARNAFSLTNIIAPGFNTGSNPYGLSYQASTGAWVYNGIDSDTILSVVGGSSGGGTGGTSGGTTDLTLNSIKVDSAQIYEYLSVGRDANGGVVAGNQVYFEHIDSVDSAFINVLDVTTFSFDSIPNDGTSIVPLYALPPEVTSVGVNGVLPDSVIPQNYLRNDSDDSTTGSITADGGFFGNLVGDVSAANGAITTLSGTGLDYDSGDIATLTGLKATFDSLFGEISGTYIDSGTIANDKLINSKVVLSDGSNTQDVALGQTFTIAGGTDINVSVAATRTATVNNTSTLATVTSRGDSTSSGITVGNFKTTGYIRGPSVLTIDPEDYDSISGTVRILGDLQVEGTTTTINSTEISINDKTLTLADSVATAALADGAGIIIDGANATWLYKDVSVTGSDSAWVSNIRIVAPEFSGALNAGNLFGTLPDSVLPSGLQLGGDGTIDSVVIPDLFLRNNGNDSTTGSITADGGFVGNLDADSADITNLTGDSATFTLFRGDLVGRADSASVADRWTNARTVTFAGGAVTGNFSIRGDSDVGNISLAIDSNAVALGTQTTGDYVAGVTAGNGISLSATTGEGFTPTISVNDTYITGLFSGGTGVTITGDSISIGQDVATSADVQFASIIADSVVSIGETTSRDYLTIGGATTNETFGITFVDPTTATSGAHVSYKDSTNTLTLGTVSSSNKTEAITIEPTAIGIFNTNPDKALDVTGEIRASSVITSSISGSAGFSGDGRALTNIDAAEITYYTAYIPSSAIGGNYTNITGVGTLNAGSITNGFGSIDIGTDNVTAGTFFGSGASLTNLPAGELTGIIDSARISGNYVGITAVGDLVGGSIDSTFGDVNIGTSTFTGDGSGIFNVNATSLDGLDLEELSRTVVLTDSDTSSGAPGVNYWYKIAKYNFQTTAGDGTFLYSIMPEDTTAAHSGATVFSVQVRYAASSAHLANIDIFAMGGTVPFADNSFIITKNSNNAELWMKTNISGVRMKVVELSSKYDNIVVDYNNLQEDANWQSSTPSGTGTSVTSDGLKYRGFDVFHQGADLDSATLNNPTITGDLTLSQTVEFLDGSVSGNTLLKHGSLSYQGTNNQVLDTNTASSITAGKYLITAQRGSSNHITEINFITTSNGLTVSSTEFGTVYTQNALITVDMDISSGNTRLLVAPTSSSQNTTIKFQGTIFFDT